MKTFKIVLIWLLGVLLTMAAAKYQRATGPTHPYKTSLELKDDIYNLELIRSGYITEDALVELDINNNQIAATLNFRLYPTNNSFTTVKFENKEGKLVASLPKQPMAGKLEYYVAVESGNEKVVIPHQIIRFKGEVPMGVLIPHILFMFLSMLFANVAGLLAIFNFKQFKLISKITLLFVFIGGMILGPVVQKYAFNEFWAGIPFGWDLTDNKTLIAFVFWIIAFIANWKAPSRVWTIMASLITLIIFAIPHSMFGSELDPETGEIIQGSLLGVLLLLKNMKVKIPRR